MNKYKVIWDERLGEALVDEPIELETAGAVITRISIETENPFGFDECSGGYYAFVTVKGHDFTVDIDIADVHSEYDEVRHWYDPREFFVDERAVRNPAVITDFIDEDTAEQLYFDVRDQILDVAPELWAEHCKHCPDSAPYKWDQGEPEEW